MGFKGSGIVATCPCQGQACSSTELAIERACEAHLPECELKAASESLQKALLRAALDAARFLDARQKFNLAGLGICFGPSMMQALRVEPRSRQHLWLRASLLARQLPQLPTPFLISKSFPTDRESENSRKRMPRSRVAHNSDNIILQHVSMKWHILIFRA